MTDSSIETLSFLYWLHDVRDQETDSPGTNVTEGAD